MFTKLLKRIELHLSEMPFVRMHWWSRPWISAIDIHPPLSKENPLWKRSPDELGLLYLCDKSPEELGREVEDYLSKPYWKRWFIFGMSRKQAIWNYYRRCLRYQIIRNQIPEIKEGSIFSIDGQQLLDDAIDFAYKHYLKYYHRACLKGEQYDYEKDTGNVRSWRVLDIYEYLEKKITRLSIEEQILLESRVREEICAIGAFMQSLYSRVLYDATPFYKKIKKSISTPIYTPKKLFSVNQASPIESKPLDNKKSWVTTKRGELANLLEQEDTDQLLVLNNFFRQGLDEIKNIIDPYFKTYNSIMDNSPSCKLAIEELGKLQHQIKTILRRAELLFHPDQILKLTKLKEVSAPIVNDYSQQYHHQCSLYIEQLERYQDRLQVWHEWLEEDENAKIIPKELDKIVQFMEKLSQSLQEMKIRHKEQKALFLQSKHEKNKYLNEIRGFLQQYWMKFTEEDDSGLFFKTIKGLFKFKEQKKEWAKLLKSCIDQLEMGANFWSLYQIVKCIVTNVSVVKCGFLGHLKFNDEFEKLGSDLVSKMGYYIDKNCVNAECLVGIYKLREIESKSLKRGMLLIDSGMREAQPEKDNTDIELKIKFFNLSGLFYKMQKQYDHNEFENPIPSTETNTSFSP